MARMLKRLFSRSPTVRVAEGAEAQLQQIDALRGERGAELVALLAREGASDEVRRRAAARLDDRELLTELLGEAALADTAAERLVTLLDPADVLTKARSEPRLALAALRSPSTRADHQGLLELLGDEDALGRAALEARDLDVRLAALGRIRSEAGLTALEREARTHDKRLLRAVRARLEQLRALRARDAELGERLGELCARLEHLIERGHSTPEQRRLARREAEHIQRSWEQALEAREEVVEQAAGFDWQPSEIDVLAQRFETASRGLAALEAAAQDADEAADDAAQAARSAASDSLRATVEGLESGSIDVVRDMALVRTALNLERERYESAGSGNGPQSGAFEANVALIEAALEAAAVLRERAPLDALPSLPKSSEISEDPAAFEPTALTLRRIGRERRKLEREFQTIAWPATLAEPAALRALRERCQALQALEEHGRGLVQAAHERLAAAIDALERHIDAGELAAALEARARARQWLAGMPRGSAEREQSRLNALAARVEELKDWREFVTAPKREALCEKMEALADAPQAPEERARAVRALRDEWRKLGAPRNAADHRLRERFDAAAERAFEPCRAHFEAQAREREANAALREEIIEQLTAFAASVNWDHVNWKSIETILRTANREWRAAFPVPRKAARAQERRFEAARRAIDEHLQAEYARNLEKLEAIVDEAEALAGQDAPLGARMDAAKALQKRWQAIGPTPPRRNRALWKRFRAACDAVFAERDAERDAGRKERAARIAEIEAVAVDLEGRLDRDLQADDEAALRAANERITALRGAERVRDSAVSLALRRFEDARERLEARLASARHAERIAAIQALIRSAEAVAELEARSARPSDGELTGLREALDRPASRLLEARLDALSAGETLVPPSPTARRELCLEVELIAGLESPEADRELRMQVQVERLSRGMSGRERADPLTLLEGLAERWCALPVSGDHDLDPRFTTAFAEALADVAR